MIDPMMIVLGAMTGASIALSVWAASAAIRLRDQVLEVKATSDGLERISDERKAYKFASAIRKMQYPVLNDGPHRHEVEWAAHAIKWMREHPEFKP